jgi:hypothetical protein
MRGSDAVSRAALRVANTRRFTNNGRPPWAYVTMHFGFSRCLSSSVPAVFLAASLSSCGFMVGPDYEPPTPPLAEQYRERLALSDGGDYNQRLVKLLPTPLPRCARCAGYSGNRTRSAGVRVLEAQASAALRSATLPQQQDAFASPTYFESSRRSATRPNRRFHDQRRADGVELDLWGSSVAASKPRTPSCRLDYLTTTCS